MHEDKQLGNLCEEQNPYDKTKTKSMSQGLVICQCDSE